MKSIKMPSIKQYRDIVRDVIAEAQYIGQDSNDDPVFDPSIQPPVARFHGTVKIHGTNASLVCSEEGFYPQKKTGPVTIEKDNAGFAFFVSTRPELHTKLENIRQIMQADTVVVYGEFAGLGIQKGVGVSSLPKTFYPFGIKYINSTGTYWVRNPKVLLETLDTVPSVKSVYGFDTFSVEVDFSNPKPALDKMQQLTPGDIHRYSR